MNYNEYNEYIRYLANKLRNNEITFQECEIYLDNKYSNFKKVSNIKYLKKIVNSRHALGITYSPSQYAVPISFPAISLEQFNNTRITELYEMYDMREPFIKQIFKQQ